MASLHRDSRGKTPYWIAAYTDQFGIQRKRSTKQTDKKAAKAVMDGFQRAEDLARHNNLTEQAAREILNEILQRTGKDPIYAPTVQEYMDGWLKRELSDPPTAMNQKQKMVARLFIDSLRSRANIPLTHILEDDILKFRDHLAAQGRSPATANHLVRGVLGAPFKYALDKGWISVNPVACIKKPTRTRKMEKGTFSPEQIVRLIAAADIEWKGMILLGFFTGQRLSDLANLKWSNVHLDKEIPFISIHQRKTDAAVTVPLRNELIDYLLGLPSKDSGDSPVFPTLYGRETGGQAGLSVSFTNIMKAAGIQSAALRERTGGVSRAMNALSFHSLRHSCNSAMANSGVSQELRMKVTGHSSKAMNNIYSHHEMETIRGALNKLPKLA